MVDTTSGVLVVPLIVACILLAVLIVMVARPASAAYRNNRAERARLVAQRDLCAKVAQQLINANAAVIFELESHPATYETLPQSVRDEVYAAREMAATLEGKYGIDR